MGKENLIEKKDEKNKVDEKDKVIPETNEKDKVIEELRANNKRMEEQFAAQEKKVEEMEKQIKYAHKKTPLPENQTGLPKGMQESQIKTTVRDISTIIKEKMDQLKDLATMEVLLDVHVRSKNRLESIKKMTSAEHIKVRGVWKTFAPKMHISGLTSKKINNDEFEISFGVYEIDGKGNKRLYTQYADVLMHDGSTINRPTSAEYRIAYEVVEKIKSNKAITREVVKLDKIQETEDK